MTDVRRPAGASVAGLLCSVLAAAAAAQASSDFLAEPTWQPVAPEAASTSSKSTSRPGIAADRQAEVRDLWRAEDDNSPAAICSIAWRTAWPRPTTASPSWSSSAPACAKPGPLPEFAWLADSETPLSGPQQHAALPGPLARAARLLRRSDVLDRRPDDRRRRRARSAVVLSRGCPSSARPTRRGRRRARPIAAAPGRAAAALPEAGRPDAARSGRLARRFARPHLAAHGRHSPPARARPAPASACRASKTASSNRSTS